MHPRCLLTKQQLKVMDLMAKGLNDKEIALRLDRAEGTVRNLRSRAYKRLNANCKLDALLKLGYRLI